MTPSQSQPTSSRSVMLSLGATGVPAVAALLKPMCQANLQAKTTGHRPPSLLLHLPSPRHHPRSPFHRPQNLHRHPLSQLLRLQSPLRHHQSHPAEDQSRHHLLPLTKPQPSPSTPPSPGFPPPRPSRRQLSPGIKQLRPTPLRPARRSRGTRLRTTRLCWLVSCLVLYPALCLI